MNAGLDTDRGADCARIHGGALESGTFLIDGTEGRDGR